MRSYFSRIARQSGLGTSANRNHGSTTRSDAEPLSSIDREDVVMVSGNPKPDSPRSGRERRTPDEGAAVRENDLVQPIREEPATDVAQGSITPLATANKSAAESAHTQPPTAPAGNGASETVQSRASERDVNDDDPPTNTLPPETFATRFIETASSPERRAVERELPASADLKKAEFFSKTAEIIEGRAVQKSEAQTILLREIQEWIASGSDDSSESSETVDETFGAGETVMTEASSADPPEAGVVRIIGERRVERAVGKQKEEAPPPETPVFELSIGTVNVVVEDDQPRAVSVPTRPSEKTGSSTERSRPRLSRSYL